MPVAPAPMPSPVLIASTLAEAFASAVLAWSASDSSQVVDPHAGAPTTKAAATTVHQLKPDSCFPAARSHASSNVRLNGCNVGHHGRKPATMRATAAAKAASHGARGRTQMARLGQSIQPSSRVMPSSSIAVAAASCLRA